MYLFIFVCLKPTLIKDPSVVPGLFLVETLLQKAHEALQKYLQHCSQRLQRPNYHILSRL